MPENQNDKKVLNVEELNNVSGGYAGDWRTVMYCKACKTTTEWLDDYRNKGPYKCPHCYRTEMWGTDQYYQD